MTTLALTAYAIMAVAWTGAAALLIGGWRRDRAAGLVREEPAPLRCHPRRTVVALTAEGQRRARE